MADERELWRRTLALERRFLRPERATLDATILAGASGPEIWQRAIAAGCLPSSWADDPGRRFFGRAQDHATPQERQAARLFASDPQGMLEAERHAHALVAALVPFGLEPRARTLVWRIAGAAIDRPEAGEPSLGQLRAPIQKACELMQRLSGRLLDPPHPHLRFRLAHELLAWSDRRARALELVIPAEFGPLAGRRLGELADPFRPWLDLLATGYWIWAVWGSIELAAPFPVWTGPRPDKRGRPQFAKVSRPSPLWSVRRSRLRLGCVRGDATWVERLCVGVPETTEPGQAPLLHFGVYGGPAVLEVLRAHTPALDLDARDDEGRTASMLAAALPVEGPLGADPSELEAPIGLALGAASCAWLLARGARIDARDLRGRTSLHWAASAHRPASLSVLIRAGAELDARDDFGRTPLMLALADPSASTSALREVIEALLGAGADADARDDRGWTALHYLAAAPDEGRQQLARLLVRAGARPSRDRAGRSPADLARPLAIRDPAFDPSTPVAAGPGLWPAPARALELELALIDAAEHGDLAGRAGHDALAVWADWLQSQGDARGELLAAELGARAIGRKRRRERARALEHANLRLQAQRDRGLWLADRGAAIGLAKIELRRELGMIVQARIDPNALAGRGAHAIAEARIAVATLLEHEPLLVDLRLACSEHERWPDLVASLATLPPAQQVRRLALTQLPSEAPRIDALAPIFPRLRELRLIGHGKLDALALDWPKLEILRIRHGDSSEWGHGGRAFMLAANQLRTIDLSLPVGGRARDEELAGFRSLLAELGPGLETLRLSPLAAEFLKLLLAAPPPTGLRTLVLDRVRGQAVELLADRLARGSASWLERLDRVALSVTIPVWRQHDAAIQSLRERLPRLVLSVC